jgi:hypothetical protein
MQIAISQAISVTRQAKSPSQQTGMEFQAIFSNSSYTKMALSISQYYSNLLVWEYKLSKKRNVLSLSTAFIFSELNMCKLLYEHNKIQQLRHKLNKGSKSKVTVSIWCGHQLH